MPSNGINTNTPDGQDLLVWLKVLERILTEQSDPTITDDDQLWSRQWHRLVGEASTEIERLREEVGWLQQDLMAATDEHRQQP